MRKILRTIRELNNLGRVLLDRSEELTDNEAGLIEEQTTTTHAVCEGCGRVPDKVQDLGHCTCGRPSCPHCSIICRVCQRRGCAECMTGFADQLLAVCPSCRGNLEERLARADRLINEKIIAENGKLAFERAMALISQEMELAETLGRDGGARQLIARVCQMRVAQKLKRLEQRLVEESHHERRRLP